jgi:predicted CoA-substrate-specific enzyme activase
MDDATRVSKAGLSRRFLGIDLGAESIKIVELRMCDNALRCVRRELIDHHKQPGQVLPEILRDWPWDGLSSVGVTGRLGRQIQARQVPVQQALVHGYRFFKPTGPATLLSIGSHGFHALELRANGLEVFRESGRCSQGTGNFLRQLVERFSLSVEQADALCADVVKPSALSGRCPVILKTDMTHLANKGENRAEILAGLFDAVCENVLNLIKPGVSPVPVVLLGGVTRCRRVRSSIERMLAADGIEVQWWAEDALFVDATGAAVVASRNAWPVPPLSGLMAGMDGAHLERVPSLARSLHKVRRMPRRDWAKRSDASRRLILGFDIGSTGSKAVAIDAGSGDVVWEGYRQTLGMPVSAAQALAQSFADSDAGTEPVVALGATGSGREIVGSLMTTCYGKESVFVLNEIAAHAAGACHYDPRVDTIFEIGGQDAKYIRLECGRVIDCAMNEACSAGTGSFIEEQGSKFAGIKDVGQLGSEALGAGCGVSLGQHCSVFMAEIIDEAVAAGVDQPAIIAGLYDSIIQNYLNRVKGSRSVGQVIFCQGMPFSSDALAAAVARQTGADVVVPPNPGTVGALGIALLARRELAWDGKPALELRRFREANVDQKTTFVCRSNTGCGGAGNKCRIDCLRTMVDGHRQSFTWGGVCSLHDKATRKRKLPDMAPHPFEEREAVVRELVTPMLTARGGKRVAMSDEFMLKSLFPFFAGYVHALGLDIEWLSGADKETLKLGVQEANVPFCAPMQMFHGLSRQLSDGGADHVLMPIVRSTPQVNDEPCNQVCPIVQAAPDLMRQDLGPAVAPRLLTPEIRFGVGGFESSEFMEGCRSLATSLGVKDDRWREAHFVGMQLQREFERRCVEIGERALAYCRENDLVAAVVLGRPYTIYNPVLNSNVPALLREQGAIAVPVDCYPTGAGVPFFERMYWGYGQRILRAAHQVRGRDGEYAVYCSNYACGPDSFNLHLFAYTMEGKPFAVIETDGHSGDAGTKTRLEAFLYCVEQDRKEGGGRVSTKSLKALEDRYVRFADLDKGDATVLVPWIGPTSLIAAACLRGAGLRAEALAMPDRASLQLGRRHTSGKECLPMCLTLGRLLDRLERDPSGKFVYMIPQSNGPCRFGVYNILHKIVVERLGWADRCAFISPNDHGYFAGLPAGFSVMFLAGLMASDLLMDALLDVRPVETRPGAALEIYDRYLARVQKQIEQYGRRNRLGLKNAMWEVTRGGVFGLREILRAAAAEFESARGSGEMPTVLVVGEIYVRADAFANDAIVEKLEARGCRVRLEAMHEWIAFVDLINRREGRLSWADRLRSMIEKRIWSVMHGAVSDRLPLANGHGVEEVVEASRPYLRGDVGGESVLALGRSLTDWKHRTIDAVVNVGPMECMPTRIAESQFFHIAEREGLPSLTLSYNGDPLATSALENFAFEVQARFRNKTQPSTRPVFPSMMNDDVLGAKHG